MKESTSVNVAKLENASVVVTTYDCGRNTSKTFCTKVTGIKKLHHLQFDSAHPGIIFVGKLDQPKWSDQS